MGLRFRKSFGLGKLLRLNWSMSGPSISVGPRGASLSVGPRGVHANVGIPGTGLSWRERLDRPVPRTVPVRRAIRVEPSRTEPKRNGPNRNEPNRNDVVATLIWFVFWCVLFLGVASTYPLLRDGMGGSRHAEDIDPRLTEIWK